MLAGVGLADEQILQIDAQVLRILDVQRVLGIDKGTLAAQLLHFRNDLQRQRGFARRLGAVNLNHPAARQAAHAQRHVQPQRAGGDDLDVLNHLAFAQAHHGAFAKLFFDLCQGGSQGFGFFAVDSDGAVDGSTHGNFLKNQQDKDEILLIGPV